MWSTPARNSSRPRGSDPAAGGSSSTFGGGSWLAHATLQSGVWIDSPSRYSALIASQRLTLASAFQRAGWSTVADVPATHGAWPEGSSLYRYEKILDRDNLVYHGPKFGFSPMPDQYALQALQKLELAKRNRRPVYSEIDSPPATSPGRAFRHSSPGTGSATDRSSIAYRSTGQA